MENIKTHKKRLLGLIIGGALVFVLALAYLGLSGSDSFILDMNPSVEVRTNRLGNVSELKAINKDGKDLIDQAKIGDKSLDQVLNALLDSAIAGGYINKDTMNIIIVSDDEKNPDELNQIKAYIDSYIGGKDVNVATATMVTAKDYDRDDLDRIELSPAKMNIIEEIRDKEPSYSADELSRLSIGELFLVMDMEGISIDSILYDYDDGMEKEVSAYLGGGLARENPMGKRNQDNPGGQEDPMATETSPKGLELSVQNAMKKVLAEIPQGQINKVEVENEDGRWIYEIEGEDSSNEIEAKIDAMTGEILKMQVEDNDGDPDTPIDIDNVLTIDEVVDLANKEGTRQIESMTLEHDDDHGNDYWKVENKEDGSNLVIHGKTGEVLPIDDLDDELDDRDDDYDDDWDDNWDDDYDDDDDWDDDDDDDWDDDYDDWDDDDDDDWDDDDDDD